MKANRKTAVTASSMTVTGSTATAMTPLGQLVPWDGNPRSAPEHGAIESIAASIATQGVLQALLARPHPCGDGRLQVIAGATRLAGLALLWSKAAIGHDQTPFNAAYPVPTLVRAMTDDEALSAAVTENVNRFGMAAIDSARALTAMVASGCSPSQAAAQIGMPRGDALAALAVVRLPASAIDLIVRNERPYGWGVALTHAPAIMQLRIAEEAAGNRGAWPTPDSIRDALRAARIPTTNALFNPVGCGLTEDRDLVDGSAWFTDADAFWQLQDPQIAALVHTIEAEGHTTVDVLRDGSFEAWRHVIDANAAVRIAKVVVSTDGSVSVHRNLRALRTTLNAPPAQARAPANGNSPHDQDNAQITAARAEEQSTKAATALDQGDGWLAILVAELSYRLALDGLGGQGRPVGLKAMKPWMTGGKAADVLGTMPEGGAEAAGRRLAAALVTPLREGKAGIRVNPLAEAINRRADAA